jgi:hypothetical protein
MGALGGLLELLRVAEEDGVLAARAAARAWANDIWPTSSMKR